MVCEKQQLNKDPLRVNRVEVGDVVVLRYYDAILFKDVLESAETKPSIREAIGWLDYQDDEYIRLVWERYAEPTINENSRIRATGLAIRKSEIIELMKVG